MAGRSLGLAALSSATVASLVRSVEAATKSVAHLSPEEAAALEFLRKDADGAIAES